jgi:hypothetical protein
MPNQHEQYGDTVHLFIDMGRSPHKITLMPFTFIDSSMIILRGLIRFFISKSVSFPAAIPKLFYTRLRLCANLRVLCVPRTVALIRVRRYLLMYFTPETLLNHVFEDLRKPKAPNNNIQHSPYAKLKENLTKRAFTFQKHYTQGL